MKPNRALLLLFLVIPAAAAAAGNLFQPSQQVVDPARWWQDLQSADAKIAYQAMWKFVTHPDHSMAFLRSRLQPVKTPPADAELARIIQDLGDENFQIRDRSRATLAKLGELAEPALRQALAGKPSLDLEQSLTRLLKNLDGPAASPGQLAQLRALEILEQFGSADAKKLLRELAQGTPKARLTVKAVATLHRLEHLGPVGQVSVPVPARTGTEAGATVKDLFGDPLPARSVLRLGTTRYRHSYLATFSPDGKFLASVSHGGLHLWDVANGRELRTLTDKPLPACLDVLISPNGRYLAVHYQTTMDGVQEYDVDVWDLPANRLVQHFADKQDGVTLSCVNSMAFSGDSARLHFGTDQTLHILDVASGTEKNAFNLALPTERLPGIVVVSPRGKFMLTGSGGERFVHLWEAQSGKILHSLDNGARDIGIVCAAYAPDEKTVAIGNSDGAVKLHDAASGERLHTFAAAGKVAGLAFSPDGQTVAVAGNDRFRSPAEAQIYLWDLKDPKKEPRRFAAPDVRWVRFSPDGKTLAWGCWENAVVLTDLATLKELHPMAAHQGAVQTVAYAPSGKTIATGGMDHTVRLWQAGTGKPLQVFRGHTDKVNAVALSADDRWLASAGGDGNVILWDIATGMKKRQMRNYNTAHAVAFSPDGKYLLSAGVSRSFRVFDSGVHVHELATGNEDKVLDRRTTTLCLAFSADGTQLALGGTSAVWVREFATGKMLYQIETGANVTSVAFSRDGRTLAAGSEKTTWLWETLTREERGTFPGHGIANWVAYAGIALSQDGRTLATGSYDAEWGPNTALQVWDLVQGKEAGPLRGHRAHVNGAAFSPDGRQLATACADGTVLIWDSPGRDGRK